MPRSTKTSKPSEPASVDIYMKKLKHPLADVAAALRVAILATDRRIGEEIKWNAPTFFFTGPLEPFDPKEYKRVLVVFNFYRKDSIRLVFWRGDRVKDKTGFLEGTYPDGRRLATVMSIAELKRRKTTLRAVLKAQLAGLER